MTVAFNTPISTEQEKKPKRKIIRKVTKQSKEQVQPQTVKKIIRKTQNDPPKKIRKIKRVKKLTQSEPLVIHTQTQLDTTEKENKQQVSCYDLDTDYDDEQNTDFSEDDIECVFTVSWYHRNNSYLLDENTQEVFSKKDHSLVGLRYINEDELSVIDFEYANN